MYRAAVFLSTLIVLCSVRIAAQHPLIGTWEMISVEGIDADGNPFFLDTTAVRETKIITPTHYMLIAWDVDGDSMIFNRTMAGKVALAGEKYIEIPTHASVQIFENVQVDFRWKLDGDVFTQSGVIVRPDGKKVQLTALKFRRSGMSNADTGNPAIGTWQQVSGHYLAADGKQRPTFDISDTRFLIVTPTHWMQMDLKNKKYEGVRYGTASRNGDAIAIRTIFSTYDPKEPRVSFTQRIKGDMLELKMEGRTPDGEATTFFNVFEKVR